MGWSSLTACSEISCHTATWMQINGWKCKHMDALNWNFKYAKMRFDKEILPFDAASPFFPRKVVSVKVSIKLTLSIPFYTYTIWLTSTQYASQHIHIQKKTSNNLEPQKNIPPKKNMQPSGWFQPHLKIWVKMGIFPQVGLKNKKYLSCHHLDCPKIRFPHHSRTSRIPPKHPPKSPTCNVWSSRTWNIRWGIRLTKASFHRMDMWTKEVDVDDGVPLLKGKVWGFSAKEPGFCGTKIQKQIHGERILPSQTNTIPFWNRAADWQSWGPLILFTQQMIINHNYTLHSRYLIYSDMELYFRIILSNVSFFGWRARTCTNKLCDHRTAGGDIQGGFSIAILDIPEDLSNKNMHVISPLFSEDCYTPW